jgi:transposase
MPLPYSTDVRERVLLAYEPGEGTAAALARRFRGALNPVTKWVRALEREGRRVAKPVGRGPEPRLGAAEREALRQLGAADNEATLAEYGARLQAQTGVSVSQPGLSVTRKRLGLARNKRRCGRASAREHHRRTRRLCRSRPQRRARGDRLAGVSGVPAPGGDRRSATAQAGRHSRPGPSRRPSPPPGAPALGKRRFRAAALAALFPRPVADRARLVEAQDPAAHGRTALDRGQRSANRSGPRHHHPRGRHRLVPPLRVFCVKLTKKPL